MASDIDIELLKSSLYELAEEIGDSYLEPKSLSLILISLNLNLEDKGTILRVFKNIYDTRKDCLHKLGIDEVYNIFRNELSKYIPSAINYDNKIIYSLIRAYSKDYIEELYVLSSLLKSEYL